MEFNHNFEDKLNKLIEKYGRRETELMEEDIDQMNLDDDISESTKTDLRYIQYYFHYDKRKDETFYMNNDFKFEKEFNNKYLYFLIFYDDDITLNLRKITENSETFKETGEIRVDDLYYYINDLRIRYKNEEFNNEHVKRILNFTEELFKDKYEKMDNLIKENIIDFESLWYYLDKVDTIYKIKNLDEEICFKYKYCNIEKKDGKDDSLILIGSIIVPYDGNLNLYELEYEIKKFNYTKKIDTLKISVLQEKDQQKFFDCGDQILNIYKKIKHMYLDGNQYIKVKDTTITKERHERVIVDYEGISKYSSNPFNFFFYQTISEDNLTSEDKLIIYPFACIYNLGITKTWGITHIKNLKELKYQEDAFNFLVLEEEKKILMNALIKNKIKADQYKDFIETKGNGLVFLLYGMPGTGKTFCAEAICESLNKPLYNINVGDLGTSAIHMEEILNDILDYSKRWDAIIMIDEADIFLEERETNLIERNAMVGIFLKFLEYHNGIIFLTTNRLNSLDVAVKSRINLMISFKELESGKRMKIWEALFHKWNIEISNEILLQLRDIKLNGREIRNYMKIIIAVHENQNKKMTGKTILDELTKIMNITDEFKATIGNNSMYI